MKFSQAQQLFGNFLWTLLKIFAELITRYRPSTLRFGLFSYRNLRNYGGEGMVESSDTIPVTDLKQDASAMVKGQRKSRRPLILAGDPSFLQPWHISGVRILKPLKDFASGLKTF